MLCAVGSIILWLLHDAVLFFSASVQWLLLKTSTPAVMQCMVRWLLVLCCDGLFSLAGFDTIAKAVSVAIVVKNNKQLALGE